MLLRDVVGRTQPAVSHDSGAGTGLKSRRPGTVFQAGIGVSVEGMGHAELMPYLMRNVIHGKDIAFSTSCYTTCLITFPAGAYARQARSTPPKRVSEVIILCTNYIINNRLGFLNQNFVV